MPVGESPWGFESLRPHAHRAERLRWSGSHVPPLSTKAGFSVGHDGSPTILLAQGSELVVYAHGLQNHEPGFESRLPCFSRLLGSNSVLLLDEQHHMAQRKLTLRLVRHPDRLGQSHRRGRRRGGRWWRAWIESLTGLGNRCLLIVDLAAELEAASDDSPRVLGLFDL